MFTIICVNDDRSEELMLAEAVTFEPMRFDTANSKYILACVTAHYGGNEAEFRNGSVSVLNPHGCVVKRYDLVGRVGEPIIPASSITRTSPDVSGS